MESIWITFFDYDEITLEMGDKGFENTIFSEYVGRICRQQLKNSQRNFIIFFKDFLMQIIFKVFIDDVTIFFLFYVLVFWPQGM